MQISRLLPDQSDVYLRRNFQQSAVSGLPQLLTNHSRLQRPSTDWGGWSSGGGAAAKPADQDNLWEVHAKVQDNSTDWGGWSTEKPKARQLYLDN